MSVGKRLGHAAHGNFCIVNGSGKGWHDIRLNIVRQIGNIRDSQIQFSDSVDFILGKVLELDGPAFDFNIMYGKEERPFRFLLRRV